MFWMKDTELFCMKSANLHKSIENLRQKKKKKCMHHLILADILSIDRLVCVCVNAWLIYERLTNEQMTAIKVIVNNASMM